MKRTHMELGGKAPVIIFDDADIEAVVAGIRTFGFYNAGQDCTAACRIYAQKGIYEKFVTRLGEAVSTIKLGTQDEDGVELGPVITAAHRDRVLGFLERAKATPHIRVVTGGKAADRAGFFVEPTVLADARQDDEIVRREVFGPVVSVTEFDSEVLMQNTQCVRSVALAAARNLHVGDCDLYARVERDLLAHQARHRKAVVRPLPRRRRASCAAGYPPG